MAELTELQKQLFELQDIKYRDFHSKLMPETTNAVINVDAMPPLPLATAEQAAEEVAGLLRRFTGAKTAIHKLTAETPRFTL